MRSKYKFRINHLEGKVYECESDTEFQARLDVRETAMKDLPDSSGGIYSIELVEATPLDCHTTISEKNYDFNVSVNVVRKPKVVHLEAIITREYARPVKRKTGWTCERDENHESRVTSEVQNFVADFIATKM